MPNAPLCNSSRSRRLAAATNSSRRLDIQVTVGTSSQPVGRPVGRPVHQPAMVATAKVAQAAAAHSSGMRRTELLRHGVGVCVQSNHWRRSAMWQQLEGVQLDTRSRATAAGAARATSYYYSTATIAATTRALTPQTPCSLEKGKEQKKSEKLKTQDKEKRETERERQRQRDRGRHQQQKLSRLRLRQTI